MSVLGTFGSGDVLTAAQLNQFNNVTALYGSTTTVPSATTTPLQFSSASQVIVDSSDWHSTTTNPSRVTVNQNGIYFVTVGMQYNYNGAAAAFFLSITKNGGIIVDSGAYSGYFPAVNNSAIFECNSGDYIEATCYQTSGGTFGALGNRNQLAVMLLRTT